MPADPRAQETSSHAQSCGSPGGRQLQAWTRKKGLDEGANAGAVAVPRGAVRFIV